MCDAGIITVIDNSLYFTTAQTRIWPKLLLGSGSQCTVIRYSCAGAARLFDRREQMRVEKCCPHVGGGIRMSPQKNFENWKPENAISSPSRKQLL